MVERCIDPSRVQPWRCDGEWHRGWDGHDPYCERCPKWRNPLLSPPRPSEDDLKKPRFFASRTGRQE